ncbi:hypothetical protein F5Y10DRAFT_260208 [Nemania abortiva]|nr:hypothetical protein F5Y10DRAFT_260208 [Nemania abortiva]
MFFLGIVTSLLALCIAAPSCDVSEVGCSENVPSIHKRAIPVSDIGCWNDVLLVEDVDVAKWKLAEWGKKGRRVGKGSWHGEQFNDAGVWICNCKHFKKDHFKAPELDEAEQLIFETCGHNSSGWVWSKKWQKSINSMLGLIIGKPSSKKPLFPALLASLSWKHANTVYEQSAPPKE